MKKLLFGAIALMAVACSNVPPVSAESDSAEVVDTVIVDSVN